MKALWQKQPQKHAMIAWPQQLDRALDIHCQTAKGGAALLLSSVSMIIAILLAWLIAPDLTSQTGWILLWLLGIYACWLAWVKLSEPFHVLQLTAQGVTFFHRRGSWQLDWQNVELVTLATSGQGQEFAYVGFRIRHYQPFIQRLPLRLAVHLLTEQRHLLLQAASGCQQGQCAADYLLMVGPCEHQNVNYKGVQAMFVERMRNLRQWLAADVFIANSSLPCSAIEFCQQLNRYRLLYQNEPLPRQLAGAVS